LADSAIDSKRGELSSMSKENGTGENKRLLLIDDDPNLILLVKDYLEFRGYEVISDHLISGYFRH